MNMHHQHLLVDDDHIYKPYMLEYFDSCNKRNNYKLKTASFFCYKNNNIIIGQGSDSYFIKLELLNQFKEYYNIIKNYDYVNYHDDHYISYYFHSFNQPLNNWNVSNVEYVPYVFRRKLLQPAAQ